MNKALTQITWAALQKSGPGRSRPPSKSTCLVRGSAGTERYVAETLRRHGTSTERVGSSGPPNTEQPAAS